MYFRPSPSPDANESLRVALVSTATLWHGGEGKASKDAYVALTAGDKNALIKFLESL